MNKVIFIGRLTANPELKALQSGTVICNFSIAIDRKFKKDGQPTADFFNCIAFSKTGEFINKWFTKGKMIALEGSLQTRSWEDNDNKKRYVTEVIVENVEFCGSANESGNTSNNKPIQKFEELEDDNEDSLPF